MLFSLALGQGRQVLDRVDDTGTVAQQEQQEVPAGFGAIVAGVDMLPVAVAVAETENADFAESVGLAGTFLVVQIARIGLAAPGDDLSHEDSNTVCEPSVAVRL